MTTIRAYGDAARFTGQCLKLIDANNGPFLLLWQTNRWLSVACDTCGGLVAIAAACFILSSPSLDAGVAGLSLSYAITSVSACIGRYLLNVLTVLFLLLQLHRQRSVLPRCCAPCCFI